MTETEDEMPESEEPTPCPRCGDVVDLETMRSDPLVCPNCDWTANRCDQCKGSGRFDYGGGMEMACDNCGGSGLEP